MGNTGMSSSSQQLEYWRQLQKEAELHARLQMQAQGLGQYQNVFGSSPSLLQQYQQLSGIITQPTPAVDPKAIEALKAVEPRKVMRRMPDSLTPITAWRAWALTQDAGEYRLKALGQHSIWLPKKKIEATCAKGGTNHPAPHFSCECGVWCFKTLELLLPALEGYTVPILGNVSIWGRIIETDKGFRAQYAYPKELWLLDKNHEQIGYIYGVPVRSA